MANTKQKIQAAVLSAALLLPAGNAFAHCQHHRRSNVASYTHRGSSVASTTVARRRHHYSRTRGAVLGAVAGAVIEHKKPLKGAVIGAAVGNAVQAIRNHH